MILKRLYPARGDDGKIYEVHVYAETAHETGENPQAPIEHLAFLATADGQKLEVLGKGHYCIAETGIVLRSYDPQAV